MRGHIRQRGKTSWAIVLELGHDAEGKRKQKWHSGFKTRKDAQAELARLMHEMNTGAYIEPSRLTFGDYLDRWLADYARIKVSAKTFERYTEIVRLHLKPALVHHPLAKLQPLHIQAYYATALQSGRKDGKGGLSAQTVLHHHRVLREALQQAVRWLLLARNPADAVEPPRPANRQIRVLDETETARLLRAVADTKYYVPSLLAVSTGMRRGEILALRWDEIDLDAGTLAVRQTLEQTRAGLAFKQPKTQKSRRLVALPPLTVDALRRHRVEQTEHRLALGPMYNDQGLVFPQRDGALWNPNTFSACFIPLADRAGLGGLRFHDLRHSHATQLLRQGVHPKIVSERLGHSTIGITLDVYSHVVPGMQEEAARKTDAALRAALSPGAD
jgi:integrase